jgi:hypothetical protein
LRLPSKGGASNRVFNFLGDRAGGLGAVGNREIVHLKRGVVSSDFQLEGFSSLQNASEGPDDSLWDVRAASPRDWVVIQVEGVRNDAGSKRPVYISQPPLATRAEVSFGEVTWTCCWLYADVVIANGIASG